MKRQAYHVLHRPPCTTRFARTSGRPQHAYRVRGVHQCLDCPVHDTFSILELQGLKLRAPVPVVSQLGCLVTNLGGTTTRRHPPSDEPRRNHHAAAPSTHPCGGGGGATAAAPRACCEGFALPRQIGWFWPRNTLHLKASTVQ